MYPASVLRRVAKLFPTASPRHILTTFSTDLPIVFPTVSSTIWVADRFSTLFPTDFVTARTLGLVFFMLVCYERFEEKAPLM